MQDLEIGLRLSDTEEEDFLQIYKQLSAYSALRTVFRKYWERHEKKKENYKKMEIISGYTFAAKIPCPVEAYFEAYDLFEKTNHRFLEQIVSWCIVDKEYESARKALE